MRADRLVAILLLLQRRTKVTAAEVAIELEVSERTARRDLEALGMAGLPVYPTRGRGGGWMLAGGGRTDLSGLSDPEVRALFLVAGPSSRATPEVRSALRKLLRAVPEPFKELAENATEAVLVDRSGWEHRSGTRPDPPLLELVQDAVVRSKRAELGYVDRSGAATTRVVDPLGLVDKSGVWYLLASTHAGIRTFRVDRIRTLVSSEEPALVPKGFDLQGTWASVVGEVELRRTPVLVRAMLQREHLGIVRWVFGTRLVIGSTATDGRVAIELRGHSVASLAGEIAGFGSAILVLEPTEICNALATTGRELLALYG